ncbi:MAG: transglutaminaseTgpA domain-containing protein, partial [Nocardioidaceae bacterium]
SERRHAVGWGHHLADLGRYATGLDEAATRGRGLAVTGRRAGLGAVACAVIVPLFVPTLTPQLFGEGGSGLGGGNGFGDVTVDNPILDMRRNLTGQSNAVLVRVKDASAPPAYLRLTALTDLTSKGWGPGERGRDTEPVDASLPDAPGVGAEVVQTTVGGRVTLTDAFHTRWLPVVYAPRSIAVDGPWRVDRDNLDIMAGRKDLDGAGVTYTFSSAVIEPTPEQLRSAPSSGRDMRGMTLTPPSMPDSIKQRAREVTKGQDNEFDKALALQRWFRSEGGFEYDLTPRFDGSGMETIARFVDDDRRGYCEQFASAMAMMARTLEIPARVAVGFLRPERNGDVFVFRGTDMHSWPELFFDGVGWVRFEPTPGGSGYTAPSFGTVDTPNGAVAPSLQGDRGQAAQPQATKTAPPLAVDGGTAPEGTSWGEMVAVGVAALVALLLLAAPFLVRTTVSRRRWRRAVDGPARAEAAWAELRSRALDLGVPWDPDATPRSTGRELRDRVAGDADATGALDLLVTQIERARYDRDCEPSGLRAAVDRVVACLAVRSTRRRRLIARWLPTAWLHGLTTSGRRTRDDGSGLIALRE